MESSPGIPVLTVSNILNNTFGALRRYSISCAQKSSPSGNRDAPVALTQKEDLENWQDLFWELTEKPENEILALHPLKEPLRTKIKDFMRRMDIMMKRGLFDGTCDICLLF
jgi:hypothetical protein